MKVRARNRTCAKPVVVCLASLALAPAGAQQPTFRGGADAVAMYASVTDERGRAVKGLTAADFTIYDKGVVRPVSLFSAEAQPITAALLFDMYCSVAEITWLQAAGEALVSALGPADRVRIGTFGNEIALSPRLTGEKGYLLYVLHEELWHSTASPLWLGIDRGMTSLAAETGRRVVIAFSKSWNVPDEGAPRMSARQLKERAQRDGFLVYTIILQTSDYDHSIRSLAEESGGSFFRVRDASMVGGALVRIVEELRGQYTLGFVPAELDNQVHDLSVRVKRPGATVTTRKNYFAAKR
jgi:Ca-activated chloride channel homolog